MVSCYFPFSCEFAMLMRLLLLIAVISPSTPHSNSDHKPMTSGAHHIGVEHLYGASQVCKWDYPRRTGGPATRQAYPEVYWINMDTSPTRRHSMQTHLDKIGFRHFRIRGVAMQDIYIPQDIEATWNHHINAKYDSAEDPRKTFLASDKQFFLNSLFGRKHKNKLKELGCTMSHLVAMRTAIYSSTATSRYALIVEDDVQFPFDIDYEALAASAPEGFGILQLFNSNEDSMSLTYENYKKHVNNVLRQTNNNITAAAELPRTRPSPGVEMTYLWRQRRPHQHLAFWSTCAFLIDREVMKPIIDKIIEPYLPISNQPQATDTNTSIAMHSGQQTRKPKYTVRIIAGLKHPCTPVDSLCCRPSNSTNTAHRTTLTNPGAGHMHAAPVEFRPEPPCIFAPQGFQADSYIYALAATVSGLGSGPGAAYVCSLPLITNGLGGNESTFHQDHVLSIHFNAFQKQRMIINELLSGDVVVPTFARPACTSEKPLLLPPMERVSTEKNCQWPNIDALGPAPSSVSTPTQTPAILGAGFLNVIAILSPSANISTVSANAMVSNTGPSAIAGSKGVQLMPNSSIEHYRQVFAHFNIDDQQTASQQKQKAAQRMGAHFHMQQAILAHELIVPDDIEKTWRGTKCKLQSSDMPMISTDQQTPHASEFHSEGSRVNNQELLDALDANDLQRTQDIQQRAAKSVSTGSSDRAVRYIVDGLCGRGANKNTVDDLALTVTHLVALHRALRFYRQQNARNINMHKSDVQQGGDSRFSSVGRYALIIEEDVQFAFDIDFRALIQSAPPQFAMLQLTNTDHKLLYQRHRKYYDPPKPSPSSQPQSQLAGKYDTRMWGKRDTFIESWATSAYIVDLAVVGRIIDTMVSTSSSPAAGSASASVSEYRFKVVAGLPRPCVPKECCISTAQGVVFAQPAFTQTTNAQQAQSQALSQAQGSSLKRVSDVCVLSPKGFISDAFIPSMFDYPGVADISAGGVYVANLPLVVNGLGGKFNDPYNQRYRMDKESAKGLQTQRRFVNQLYEAEKSSVPSFMTPACLFGVEKEIS